MNKPMSGRNVLVVEDEYFIADDLAHKLQDCGAEVIGPLTAPGEALDRLKAGGIDLAIVDINLRGEPSFALADALIAGGVPFIFATGYDESAIPEEYRHVPRWEKPFDIDALIAAVSSMP